jgi:hypothetical protein
MREPIALPNTTKYSEVDITGERDGLGQSTKEARHFEQIDGSDSMPMFHALTRTRAR